jgi:ketosteroid isomerase-like protein
MSGVDLDEAGRAKPDHRSRSQSRPVSATGGSASGEVGDDLERRLSMIGLRLGTDRAMSNQTFQQAAERIYHEWDKALADGDVDRLLGLYAPDAILESPVVPVVTDREVGVCRGHEELRPVLEQVRDRKPPLRTYYRTGYLTDGSRMMIFEYPRDAPNGEQMDFVEVMEISDGLIQRHRVYWGWRGMQVIRQDAYHRE